MDSWARGDGHFSKMSAVNNKIYERKLARQQKMMLQAGVDFIFTPKFYPDFILIFSE